MITKEMEDRVRNQLRLEYDGIFPPHQIESYFVEYVGLSLAEGQIEYLKNSGNLSGTSKVLDIGCGYGSFVVACRKAGFSAFGIDTAQFEIDFAKERLTNETPSGKLDGVFQSMSAQHLLFEEASFDLVTLWNAIEHIPNVSSVFSEVFRILRPGGACVILAPNYLAFRQEAHYLVPWFPLLPRRLGRLYLKALGRRPSFLETSIHYVTLPGVQKLLRRQGFRLEFARSNELQRALRPELINNALKRNLIKLVIKLGGAGLLKLLVKAYFWNPFCGTIKLIARKPQRI